MKTIIEKLCIRIIILFFTIALCFGCKNQYSKKIDFSGLYEGEFTHGNFSTPIKIEIEKDSINYKVYFTSPDQNTYRIPTSNVSYTKDSIKFELNSDYYSFKFKNKISEHNDYINANLTVDSVAQDFILHKIVDYKNNNINQEEVTFQSDSLNLKGTIYYPSKPSNKVLYFVTSSGNSDRSASRAEAIKFTDQGFITFHFDKRGTGASEGNWEKASIEDLALDDITAINFLSKKLNIPLSNIGIKGSSQGGTKVPLILSEMQELAFGIVVSCPSTSLLESDLNYWKNRNQPIIQPEYFEDAFAFERLVFQYIAGITKLERLEEEISNNKNEPWFLNVWIPNLSEIEIDNKLKFTPVPYFERINQPILIIQGTKDEIIPENSSASLFGIAKERNNKSKVVSLVGANHSIQLVENNGFPYWPMPHPDYLTTVYKWLDEL